MLGKRRLQGYQRLSTFSLEVKTFSIFSGLIFKKRSEIANFCFVRTQECLVRGGCRATTFYFLPEGENFLNISLPYIHRMIRNSKFLLLSKTFLRTQGCLIRGRSGAATFYFLPGSQYFLNFRGLIFRLLRSFLRIQG